MIPIGISSISPFGLYSSAAYCSCLLQLNLSGIPAPDRSQCSRNPIEALANVFEESVRLQEANFKAIQDLVKFVVELRQSDTHDRTAYVRPGQPSS